MTKLTALAATVAIAIVAAGCGSVAEQNDYVEQVNAEQTQLLDSIGNIVSGSAPTNSLQAAAVAGKLSRAFATSADEIEAIEPPDNVAELHGQLVDGMRGLSDRLREAQRALAGGNAQRAAEAAADLQRETSKAQARIQDLIDRINAELES